jgi:DNA-binding transcriptional LysR family regulator
MEDSENKGRNHCASNADKRRICKPAPPSEPNIPAWRPAEVPLTVFPFISNLAAVVGGLGLGLTACVAGDQHPDLIRLGDVIDQWDVWMITNPEARNNARVRVVKDAMLELLETDGERLSGGKMEPKGQ